MKDRMNLERILANLERNNLISNGCQKGRVCLTHPLNLEYTKEPRPSISIDIKYFCEGKEVQHKCPGLTINYEQICKDAPNISLVKGHKTIPIHNEKILDNFKKWVQSVDTFYNKIGEYFGEVSAHKTLKVSEKLNDSKLWYLAMSLEGEGSSKQVIVQQNVYGGIFYIKIGDNTFYHNTSECKGVLPLFNSYKSLIC